MKNLQYIILLLLAIAGILVGLYYANSLLEPVHRDQPGKSGIEPPSDRPLRVFFERELYTDKIAYITPRERAILMNHAHQFRLKALFEPVEILEPAWQEGNVTATLSCRVEQLPEQGN
ncbi:MAG: hypothetical protein U5N86_07765 [Planctomycetota bacterium]|nr:hypothetical protein [Planctomycetota bacterium]